MDGTHFFRELIVVFFLKLCANSTDNKSIPLSALSDRLKIPVIYSNIIAKCGYLLLQRNGEQHEKSCDVCDVLAYFQKCPVGKIK
jgi:hypothetical protein